MAKTRKHKRSNRKSKHGGKRKKQKKKKRTMRKTYSIQKRKAFGRKKSKTPTSLSIFPDKSPQLQDKGVPTKLNSFTSKNVAIRDSKGREFNAIINDRLAYRRAPRGQNVEDFSEILYGPSVVQLSKANYKKMKKGDLLYFDRGSVALRGPFKFINVTRGPEILLEVADTAYNKKYLFSISVNRLSKEKLYLITNKSGKSKRHSKKRKRRSRK
ncbi:MAG: hypothetical protein S4CHLAM20_08400 [Chlamydiia bacterium]|jgi:hypothetical protein|nr:hypothetical protein [Chlamydiia bacterium]